MTEIFIICDLNIFCEKILRSYAFSINGAESKRKRKKIENIVRTNKTLRADGKLRLNVRGFLLYNKNKAVLTPLEMGMTIWVNF